MASEDAVALAWNIQHRRELKVFQRQHQARTTPIQRAMDPKAVAAAKKIVYVPAASHGRRVAAIETSLTEHTDHPNSLEYKQLLMLERTRRRELYRGHLDSILAQSLLVRSRRHAATGCNGLGGKPENGIKGNPRGGAEGNRLVRATVSSPGRERARLAERDGAECELTEDMLSHLGPLKDLAELELCVEGLTSASLLRACTSLKSLSLSVNRLSSSADLVASITLVRLGLRWDVGRMGRMGYTNRSIDSLCKRTSAGVMTV